MVCIFSKTGRYSVCIFGNIQIKEALHLLEMAGLVYTVMHSSSNGIPLGAGSNPKFRKMLLFDTGIYQRVLGLNLSSILLEDDVSVTNKGNIAELSVGLELLKNTSCYEKRQLYYWQRESKNSQAEVDYVLQKEEKIVPVEVKAGSRGAMQSMYVFLQEKKQETGFRVSMENFGLYDNVRVFPLYAVANLEREKV